MPFPVHTFSEAVRPGNPGHRRLRRGLGKAAHAPQPGRSQGPKDSRLRPRSIRPAINKTELCVAFSCCSPCVSSLPDRGGLGEGSGSGAPPATPADWGAWPPREGSAVEAAGRCQLSRGHPGGPRRTEPPLARVQPGMAFSSWPRWQPEASRP